MVLRCTCNHQQWRHGVLQYTCTSLQQCKGLNHWWSAKIFRNVIYSSTAAQLTITCAISSLCYCSFLSWWMMYCSHEIYTLNTDISSCPVSLKVLECVPRLCQLSSYWLSWRSSSCLGVSKTRVQEDAIFWKPLWHVCQPNHPPTQHYACTPEPSYLRPDQPGNAERANMQTQPHPNHTVCPCMQHSTTSAQELVNPSKSFNQSNDSWSSEPCSPYDPNTWG